MNIRSLLLALLLLLPCILVGAQATESRQDQTITVVGMILSASSNLPKGTPDRWRIDLNDDMDAELTLLNAGANLPGNELIEAGIKVEVVITPLDLEKATYGLVRWVRVGLRR